MVTHQFIYTKIRNSMICNEFLVFFQPVFLNEALVKQPSDPSSDEPVFHISHIDRVYTLKTENINERLVSEVALFIAFISLLLFTGHIGQFLNRKWNVCQAK